MINYFCNLKVGEQFDFVPAVTEWDMMKIDMFKARAAHLTLKDGSCGETWTIMPWQRVQTIIPNPNCTDACACKHP